MRSRAEGPWAKEPAGNGRRAWKRNWRRALVAGAVVLALAGCQTGSDVPPQAGTGKPAPEQPVAAPPPQQAALPPPHLVPPPVSGPLAGPPGQPAPARAALLVPLSGQNAAVGQALQEAAQMAVYDIAGDGFVLQTYDTRGTPDGAASALTRALGEGAQIVLGPVFGSNATAIAAQAQAAGVRVLTFSTDRTVAQPGVYVLGYLPREQARSLVALALAQGLTRFAVVAPDTPYGRTLAQAYQDEVARQGGTLVRQEVYGPSSDAVAEAVRRLSDHAQRKAALPRRLRELTGRTDPESMAELARLGQRETVPDLPFDVLLVGETVAPRLKELASYLAFYDVEPGYARLAGPMPWAGLGLERDPAFAGAWYPAPAPGPHGAFRARYERLYGRKPQDIASLGYDAAALAAILARQPGSPGVSPYTDAALLNPAGFAGVDGLFRLAADGTVERGFAVMEVRPDGTVVAAEAPAAFDMPLIAPPPATAAGGRPVM